MADVAVKVGSRDRSLSAICAGKDCRKRCEFDAVRRALEADGDVVELKCIGICKGPVVVVNAGTDSVAVFAKVRSKKQRRRVVSVARDRTRSTSKLDDLAVSGKYHRAALRRLGQAFG